jgi:hypothetical protein
VEIGLSALPNFHAVIAILLAVLAIVMYTRDRIPLTTSSILILCIVSIWVEVADIEFRGERIDAGDIFAGFGNQIVTACASPSRA